MTAALVVLLLNLYDRVHDNANQFRRSIEALLDFLSAEIFAAQNELDCHVRMIISLD